MALPATPDPVPASVLEILYPEESQAALAFRGWRQPSWVGGRLAAHHAIARLGGPQAPLLIQADGGVQCPPGLALSISHTRDMAVALVGFAGRSTLGVDLESLGVPRVHLAPRILRPEEWDLVADLPPDRQWISILLRFCVKEALYKALRPFVPRYIGFQEAAVHLKLNGTARVDLHLDPPAGPFRVEAHYHWLQRRILATVRVWPEADPSPAGSSEPEPR